MEENLSKSDSATYPAIVSFVCLTKIFQIGLFLKLFAHQFVFVTFFAAVRFVGSCSSHLIACAHSAFVPRTRTHELGVSRTHGFALQWDVAPYLPPQKFWRLTGKLFLLSLFFMFVFFVPLSAENSVTGTDRKSLFDNSFFFSAGGTKFRLGHLKTRFFFCKNVSVFFPHNLCTKS